MKKLLIFKILLVILMVISGCSVGPDYKRPDAPVPSSFKELKGWRQALPRDQEIRTKWWEAFGDPILNSLGRTGKCIEPVDCAGGISISSGTGAGATGPG